MLTLRICALAVLVCGVSFGQINSRAEEIEAARAKKAQELSPDTLSTAERTLNWIKDKKIIERLTAGIAGFRIRLGGLTTGSGFALGPEYLRRDIDDGRIYIRSSVRASLKKYQLFDLEFRMPRLANDRAFLRLYAAHRNYPQMQYYGPGPDSNKGARSNYRLEDTSYDFETGIRPFRNMNLGVTGGYLQVNVGPGTNTRYISTERIFNEFTTPGITQQSDFLRGGVFAQYDFRDNVGGPRRGGNYFAEFSYYDDRDLGRHDHRRLHMEAQQYIPFFNERRVIALRAASTLTYANRGQRVPFYLQPVIGGGDTVRGYRPFRFHDDNSILLNGEYRWEVFSGMDMAIFADAGKVFRNKRQWNLHDLESSVGVGLRFNVRNDVFMRLDSGFSHEGFQVWVKFNNIF